jgi:hypothetical protein
MQFLVFKRADSALLVVPSLFQPPLATRTEGPLVALGVCELDVDRLDPAITAELGRHGYAVVYGDDWAALQVTLQLATHRTAADTDATAAEEAQPS